LRTQLLCTFAHRKDLDLIVDYISKSYTISEKRMFVFSNAEKSSELYVTYNVEPDDYKKTPNTIMIHRKKETNTLYTVNALNAIIRKSNNGVLDKKFVINWQIYDNSLMLTDGDDIRHIHLDLHKRIDL
jgi:hypothetical protein|tara:strand:- start:212 stop:598 length:387 start_codon:yes stop_codon:yes gene_type:complete